MSTTRRIINRLQRAWRQRSAEPSRRWPQWAWGGAPARQQLARRHRDAARGHWLASASPSAAAIVEAWCTALISDGPSVRSGHPDPAMRAALEDSFGRWSQSVDTEGLHDLPGALHVVVASLVTSGEAVVRLDTGPRAEFRVALLSPEQLDPALTREVEDMRRIIAGVEFDHAGRRVAYHLLAQQPDLVTTMIGPPVRIPAEDVCHVFLSRLPGAVRGSSWLAPVATRLEQLDRVEDNLSERIAVATLFAGFVSDPSGTSGFGDAQRDPQQLALEPGTLRILPPDASITFPNLPDNADVPDYLRHLLRQIASGVGLPFELLSGDYSQTNYSAAKMAMENFKRRVKAVRETLLAARLLRPLWQRWITLEVLSGRLQAPGFERDPAPYFNVSFLWPEFGSLDPYREAQADVALINAGVRSRAEVISARGRDISDVDNEILADAFVPRMAPTGRLEDQNAAS